MLIYLIIILAIISRFIPHMPNFAPITALAIFTSANLGWKKAVGTTLAARLVSDIFLGFFSWPIMLAVYFSHLAGVVFGLWIKNTTSLPSSPLRRGEEIASISSPFEERIKERLKYGWIKIIASSLGASAIFFLVTNFAFLYSNYPHNFSGIAQSYINGLPFLRGTIMGDMFYTLALFGGYALAKYLVQFKSNKSYIINH